MRIKFELKCKPTFLTNKVVNDINNQIYNIFEYDIRKNEKLYNFYIKDGLENFINKTCLYIKINPSNRFNDYDFHICIRERLFYNNYKEAFGDEHPIIELKSKDVFSIVGDDDYNKNETECQILDYIYMRLINYILFEKIEKQDFCGYLECNKP